MDIPDEDDLKAAARRYPSGRGKALVELREAELSRNAGNDIGHADVIGKSTDDITELANKIREGIPHEE